MRKIILAVAVLIASCLVSSAQIISSNPFPGFGTVAGTAIQGPGTLGAATGTSLALGGATIGTNALAVTGTAAISGGVNVGSSTTAGTGQILTSGLVQFVGNTLQVSASDTVTIEKNGAFGFTNTNSQASATLDTILTRAAAASWQLGNIDVDTTAAMVAQTFRSQGALAGGTSNQAGVNWTFIASPGKGTGAGGSFIFQTTPAGSTGTVVGTPTTALTIDSTQKATFASGIVSSNGTAGSLILGPASASGVKVANSSNVFVVADGTGGTFAVVDALTAKWETVSSDGGAADATLCRKSSDGTMLLGSGTLGICLGTSSSRFKTGIAPLSPGLEEILRLKPKSFYMDKLHGDPQKQMYGFIAEDMVKVLPRLVGADKEGRPLNADYLGVVPVLVRAVQEQQKEILALKNMRSCSHVYIMGILCW